MPKRAANPENLARLETSVKNSRGGNEEPGSSSIKEKENYQQNVKGALNNHVSGRRNYVLAENKN